MGIGCIKQTSRFKWFLSLYFKYLWSVRVS